MDQRDRWQALQSHLSAARGFVDSGEPAKALAAIDAALAIDPDFLAAHSLRDRILAPPGAPAAPPPASAAVEAEPHGDPALRAPATAEGYAKFEARAKRRRVDRRVDAARTALERRRLREAASALDEIIELDPNLPELTELTASFDELRRHAATARRGPWFAAAASFAVVLFGATWLQETRPQPDSAQDARPPLVSVQTAGLSSLVEPPAPEQIVDTDVVDKAIAAPARGQAEIEPRPVPTSAREIPTPARSERLDEAPVAPRPTIAAQSQPVPPPPVVVSPPPVAVPAAAPVSMSMPISAAVPRNPEPVAVPPPAPSAQVDDIGLVKQALQRYRKAYDGLDAQSARAVFPAVNQAALARAFDGLESQTLTFDTCDVQLRGEAAVATCRGSARYVPKIGSREPRVEPRVWNFSLRKSGNDWTIDSARAER